MFPRHLRSRFWRKFVITVDVVGADPRSNGRANRSRYIFRHSDRSKHSNRIRYWHARYVSDPSLPFAVAWSKHPKSVEHLAGRIVERSVKPYHWLEREREKRRRRKWIMIVIIEGNRWNTNSPFLKLTPLSVSFSLCIYLIPNIS